MAIVTGDRYLDLLAAFIERHGAALLDGSLVLKLNPVGLHYLQSRLSSLAEVEALKASAPVDYLRAYVSDLGDYRKLERLRRFMGVLEVLKVVSLVNTREPTPLSLLPFSNLRSLEIRGCDLSSSPARGLLELRPTLEKLVCLDSTDALRHLFVVDRSLPTANALPWPRLSTVVCSSNGMLHMDDSLLLLTAVEWLDLSRNRFAKISHVHSCDRLRMLNLGFNSISTAGGLNSMVGNVRELVLCNNELKSTHGLEKLYGLESLDLSYNLLSSVAEVARLASLPLLSSLLLQGNPLAFLPKFRSEVLSYFPDPRKMKLDGKEPDLVEQGAIESVLHRRQRRRVPGGTYLRAPSTSSTLSPPPKPPDPEGTLHRKRLTRIAPIEDTDASGKGRGGGGALDDKPSGSPSEDLLSHSWHGGGPPMPPRSTSPSPLLMSSTPGHLSPLSDDSSDEDTTVGTTASGATEGSRMQSGGSLWLRATVGKGRGEAEEGEVGPLGLEDNGMLGAGLPSSSLSPRRQPFNLTHLLRSASEMGGGSDTTSETSGVPWSDSDDDLDGAGFVRSPGVFARPPSFPSWPPFSTLRPPSMSLPGSGLDDIMGSNHEQEDDDDDHYEPASNALNGGPRTGAPHDFASVPASPMPHFHRSNSVHLDGQLDSADKGSSSDHSLAGRRGATLDLNHALVGGSFKRVEEVGAGVSRKGHSSMLSCMEGWEPDSDGGNEVGGTEEDSVARCFRECVGDREREEVCLRYFRCGCVRVWEDPPEERGSIVLVSSEGRLFFLSEAFDDGNAPVPQLTVTASHELKDLKSILVGLALQVVRLNIGMGASYVLAMRSSGTVLQLLETLARVDVGSGAEEAGGGGGPLQLLQSCEGEQVRCLESTVLGGGHASIHSYLMLQTRLRTGHRPDDTWPSESSSGEDREASLNGERVPGTFLLTSSEVFLCHENLASFGEAAAESSSGTGSGKAPASSAVPYYSVRAKHRVAELGEVKVLRAERFIMVWLSFRASLRREGDETGAAVTPSDLVARDGPAEDRREPSPSGSMWVDVACDASSWGWDSTLEEVSAGHLAADKAQMQIDNNEDDDNKNNKNNDLPEGRDSPEKAGVGDETWELYLPSVEVMQKLLPVLRAIFAEETGRALPVQFHCARDGCNSHGQAKHSL